MGGPAELDVDVIDPAIYGAGGPPHELFARLRRDSPVFCQKIADPALIDSGWVVTRLEDVRAMSRNPEVFSSAHGIHFRKTAAHQFRPIMINMDADAHRRSRRVVSSGFTPRVLRTFEDKYRAMATDVVDRALENDEFDFVAEVAAELPLLAICDLVGAPPEDRGRILAWSNTLFSSEDPEYTPGPDDYKAAIMSMVDYADHLRELKRQTPGADLVSAIVNGDEDPLTEEEFQGLMILLLGAGNETTRNNLSGGILAMIEHPDQWADLRSDPDKVLPTAVEEVTRWASPVNYMSRTAMTETELGGVTIPEGAKVAMLYSSANRDEAEFADPQRFDVRRDPNPHVAFGFGAHYCLGANLARIETQAVLGRLAERAARLEPAGPVGRTRSSFINGIKHLPVRVIPA